MLCLDSVSYTHLDVYKRQMYLHVLLVNDTVEASDLLSLLGVGLLKFAQTLFYLAQNNIYVSIVACHFSLPST